MPVAPHVDYRLPRYDMDAFLIEAELLLDWYLPSVGAAADRPTRATRSSALWRDALQAGDRSATDLGAARLPLAQSVMAADRENVARIGVLDFQDAMIGPGAYDVASILQDARVDVPEALEVALLSRYVRARLKDDAKFDTAGFTQLYATLAAQRATKILGIFARLDRRDGKPQYLRHIPRIWKYLQRSLAHPALACSGTGMPPMCPPAIAMMATNRRKRRALANDDAEQRVRVGSGARHAHAAV